MKTALFSLMALAVVSACTEQPMSTAARPQGEGDHGPALAPRADYVRTPVGWYHGSCVHEIPSGASVLPGNVIKRPDGSTYQIPTCQHPPLRRAARNPGSPLADAAFYYTGQVENAVSYFNGADRYRSDSAAWQVPAAPLGSFPRDTFRIYFAYTGLESLRPHDLLPALQFGYNGRFGGPYWTIASWWVTDTTAYYSTPDSVAAYDSVAGAVTATGCSNGTCAWKVSTVDRTRSDTTTYSVSSDSDSYGWVYGGAVDADSFTSCSQFPSPGVFFRQIQLHDTAGSVSGNWNTGQLSDAPCYFKAQAWDYVEGGLVNLFHASLLDSVVTIGGPTSVRPNTPCIFWAITDGGVPPNSYTWTPAGTEEENYVTVSWAQEGPATLRVVVTDSLGQSAQATKSVTVSSSARVCPNVPIR
jgi:hypothetical protein